MMESAIKVLIVDDSRLVRMLLRESLESDGSITVIGEAENGRDALEQIPILKPDLVTMDLEMPIMGGHEAIEHIMASCAVPILVISSLDDAENACAAIARGALELMGKPQLEELIAGELIRKVKLLARVKVIKHLRPALATENKKINPLSLSPVKPSHKAIFAIASSTGGPQVLIAILQALPADFPAPIVIAQHICAGFEQGLADWLNYNVPLTVKVATPSETLMPGLVYISPATEHLHIDTNRRVCLSAPETQNFYHPSCDRLLQSVAASYGEDAVGIICTGMGNDGVAGMERIFSAGGFTIAQDEASSVVYGMNREAVSKNCIHQVLPIDAIAQAMLSLSGYGQS